MGLKIIDSDVLNKKFGKLTTIEYLGFDTIKEGIRNRLRHLYKCQCECGNIKNVIRHSLIGGNTTSCGCIQNKTKINNFKLQVEQGLKDPTEITALYNYTKSNSKRRNKIFELSKEDFKKLVFNNCHYCGDTESNIFQGILKYNGIDRINSSIGYIKDNVVTSCKICNRAKNDMSYEEFINYLKRIAKKYDK